MLTQSQITDDQLDRIEYLVGHTHHGWDMVNPRALVVAVMDVIESASAADLRSQLAAASKREIELRERINTLAEKLGRARGMLQIASDTLNDCGAPIDADRIQKFLAEETR